MSQQQYEMKNNTSLVTAASGIFAATSRLPSSPQDAQIKGVELATTTKGGFNS